jgi:hypothetical protein
MVAEAAPKIDSTSAITVRQKAVDMQRKAAVLVSAFALLAGACGGGGARLSKAEFLKQGNAICKAASAEIDAASAKAFPNQNEQPDPVKFKTFANETLDTAVRQQIDDIDDLKPPKDLQEDVDQLLSDARAAIDKVKEDVNKDAAAFLANETDPFTDVNKKSNDIGLTVCGEP